MDPREFVGGVWSGFTWLRIGIAGGLLWVRWWTFGFWRHGVSLISYWELIIARLLPYQKASSYAHHILHQAFWVEVCRPHSEYVIVPVLYEHVTTT
jgi:hypothetical protein